MSTAQLQQLTAAVSDAYTTPLDRVLDYGTYGIVAAFILTLLFGTLLSSAFDWVGKLSGKLDASFGTRRATLAVFAGFLVCASGVVFLALDRSVKKDRSDLVEILASGSVNVANVDPGALGLIRVEMVEHRRLFGQPTLYAKKSTVITLEAAEKIDAVLRNRGIFIAGFTSASRTADGSDRVH